MRLVELVVPSQIAVKHFGGELGLRFLVLGDEAVFLAVGDIVGVLAEHFTRHFEGVHEVRAVGEEVARFRAGQVARGGRGRAVVELRIVRDNGVNAVSTHYALDGFVEVFEEDEFPSARIDVVNVARNFVLVVRAVHHFAVKEGVHHHERALLIDFRAFVNDRKAEVIDDRAVKSICRFGVDNQVFFHFAPFGNLWELSGVWLLPFRLSYYIIRTIESQ